ncbi:Lrp/AsnC family transcriptional regulator [Pseudophaeobacter sp.]|uniref:Lrp/AsnC family transcriptional regulator n=1 Tax=Pseudophaeobacter sp. TaxID=1971739 RepID=UPI004059DE4B
MDQKDRQIIRALQREGRITNQDLAELVNLSPSPCLRRLRNLEKSGAIQGFSALADAKTYGLGLEVYVRIRLEKHHEDVVQNFERRVSAMQEVLECHMMTGQVDYQLRVLVAGLDAYENFVRNKIHPIGGVGSIETSFVYGTVKKTAVFPDLG